MRRAHSRAPPPLPCRVNVVGTLSLLDLCHARGVHVTSFATGCIYKYDDAHRIGGVAFTEEDAPNFEGSYYSMTKGHVETVGCGACVYVCVFVVCSRGVT
jgi:nucleoside-diphosphate-sugar epimerase